MADTPRRRRQPPREEPRGARFDATIHTRRGVKDLTGLDNVPLDRLPDRYGRVRALLTAEDCAQLLDLGYEIRLHRHHAIGPLDPRLIATDKSVQRWIEDRLDSIRPDAPAKRGRPRKR